MYPIARARGWLPYHLRSFASLVFVGLLVVAPAAYAGQIGVVLHGVGPDADRVTGIVTHLMQELLAKDSQDELIYANAKLGSSDRERAIKAFQQAYEALALARRSYDNLDLQGTQEQCLLALGKYERFVAYVTDFQQLAEVLMLLAATHLLQGQNDAAQDRMQQAIGLFPSIQPDPRIFNPTMRAKFSELVKASSEGKHIALAVDSNPQGATLLLNGRFIGVTPHTFERSADSRDYLRIEYPGFRPFGKVLDSKGANDYALQINLRPFGQGDMFEQLSMMAGKQAIKHAPGQANKELLATAVQLGALLDVDQVLLGGVLVHRDQVEVKVVLVDLDQQHFLSEVRHVFLFQQSLALMEKEVQVLMGHITEQRQKQHKASSQASEALAPSLRDDVSRPCFGPLTCKDGKWILLGSLMGLSAGAMALGGVFWGQAYRENALWKKAPQVSQEGERLASQGKRTALVGDIVFGLGAAMALGTGAGMIWWDPTPPLQVTPGDGELLDRVGQSTHRSATFSFHSQPSKSDVGRWRLQPWWPLDGDGAGMGWEINL